MINDLSSQFPNVRVYLYAYDTAIAVHANTKNMSD